MFFVCILRKHSLFALLYRSNLEQFLLSADGCHHPELSHNGPFAVIALACFRRRCHFVDIFLKNQQATVSIAHLIKNTISRCLASETCRIYERRQGRICKTCASVGKRLRHFPKVPPLRKTVLNSIKNVLRKNLVQRCLDWSIKSK